MVSHPQGYSVRGEGPRLVLLPELGDALESWDSVPLDRRFQVLTIDVTALAAAHSDSVDGSGPVQGSDSGASLELSLAERLVPALAALIVAAESDVQAPLPAPTPAHASTLPADAPILIGHGWGAQLALAYAARFPVAAIVLVDEVIDLAARQEARALLVGNGAAAELTDLAGPVEVAGLTDEAGLADLVAPEPSADEGVPAEISERVRDLRRPVPELWQRAQHSVLGDDPVEAEDTADRLCALPATVPVLSLHGTDPGAGYSLWLRLRVPGAVVEVWPVGGHYLHLAEPILFVRRLLLLIDQSR